MRRPDLDVLAVFHGSFPHYLWRQGLSLNWALGEAHPGKIRCLLVSTHRVLTLWTCVSVPGVLHGYWGPELPFSCMHSRPVVTRPFTWAPSMSSHAYFVDGTRRKNVTFLALSWLLCQFSPAFPSKPVQFLMIQMLEASFYTLSLFECKIFKKNSLSQGGDQHVIK